jgi:hypothetical protein
MKVLACRWRKNSGECFIEGGNTLSECDFAVEKQLYYVEGRLPVYFHGRCLRYALKLRLEIP